MSAPAAVERIIASIEKRIKTVAPFRATVDSLSAGKVAIIREGADTADTQLYARLAGSTLVATDEVLCINLAGQAVVLGKLQRSAPTALFAESDITNLTTDLAAKVNDTGDTMTGNLTFSGGKGIASQGTSPTIAVGAALGTTGSLAVAIEGTDRYGKMTLTSGALGLATGVLARITFNTALADANYQVLISCADSDAPRILAFVDYSTLTTTYWEISGAVAPILNTSHHYYFAITQYQP